MTTMYAKIQNNGMCPADRFFTLGLTTSRGNENKIGQFGSGAKHAIFTLLRAKLSLVIYTGQTKITFTTKSHMSGGHEFQQVYVIIDGVETKLNIALDFGDLDWKSSIDMAMRELIANAIDGSESVDDVLVNVVSYEPKPYDGKTTIFVEANEHVRDYVSDLSHRFLQFSNSGTDYDEGRVIPKKTRDKVRFYHKGVFVKFGHYNSLFDYNFGDDVKIDESRNLDNTSCGSSVAEYLSKDPESLREVFRVLSKDVQYYETEIYSFTLERRARSNSAIWKEAWKREFGDKTVVVSINDGFVLDKARDQGYRCVLVANSSWHSALIAAGIPTPISVLDNVDEHGHELVPATPIIYANLDKVWNWFDVVGMASNKEMPKACMFNSIDRGNTHKSGYYKDDCVYINSENQTSLQTMFHEVAHYLSGESDETRSFERFLIEYAVRISE